MPEPRYQPTINEAALRFSDTTPAPGEPETTIMPITDLAVLAGEVAAHLDGFTARARHPHTALLTRGDGAELALHTGPDGDRVEVFGIYPSVAVGRGLDQCRITVAADRGPKAIAAEVTRRLLPRFEPNLATAQARAAHTAHQTRRRETAASQLAVMLPEARVTGHDTHTVVDWHGPGSDYGTVRLDGDGSEAHIEIRTVQTELTRRLAETIRGALT